MTRALALGLLLCTLLTTAPAIALGGGTHASGNGWDVQFQENHAGGGEAGAATPAGHASSSTTYTSEPICTKGGGQTRGDQYGCGGVQKCGPKSKGRAYWIWAHYSPTDTEIVGQQCFMPGENRPPPEVTPAMVATAFQHVPVPASRVSVQPPDGATLVGLPTIFSTNADRFTRVVTLLGQQVTLDISPASYRWVHGDGTTDDTDWGGRPWQRGVRVASLITHTYDDTARLSVRVDTTWRARYRVGAGTWQDVPGTVTIQGDPTSLRIRSAEPRLTG